MVGILAGIAVEKHSQRWWSAWDGNRYTDFLLKLPFTYRPWQILRTRWLR